MARHTPEPTVHLLCNSHLDPVWLWEWPEGAGEALALARTVCDLCDEFEGFVFNRNEVQFYEWVEEYDPALFERIRALVASGQWHVMGGWYLQPDCNIPSGESFVRQILVGRRYFSERFGVTPRTAANVDSFGHTRGLVQILARSGYDSYLFCRPKPDEGPYPSTAFTWVGFDGSEVTAAVAESHYNSPPGAAAAKIRSWLGREATRRVRQIPWGVGNHGGGPSRQDLTEIAELMAATRSPRLLHSTPEAYFADLRLDASELPMHEGDLNPWAVGCYTSAMRLKRRHRQLENELFMAEKMAATAWAQGLMEYPSAEFSAATWSLLANQFHDILGGTSIPSAEESSLDELGHGLTLTRRVKTRAFFALAAGQRPGSEGSHPILVYNPHPFPVRALVECEVQPAWPIQPHRYGRPVVSVGGRTVPAQAEQEEANIHEDHRKRVVFAATLHPGRMNRFECRFDKISRKPAPSVRVRDGRLRFKTADLDIVVNARTGLLDRYRIWGGDHLSPGALRPLVMHDDADPWGMDVSGFRRRAGSFKLMSRSHAARFCGVSAESIAPVRVVEDGPVRTVVEALLAFGDSAICQRYKLPRTGTEVEVEIRVLWQEKDRMLKLSLPTPIKDGILLGQVAYGTGQLPGNGTEVVAQKWLAVTADDGSIATSVINDTTYGCDFKNGELRLSLLRAPAHAGHPTGMGRPIVQQDRFTPRLDQGEHIFHFWLNGGGRTDRLAAVDREASVHNERPFALSYWPPGGKEEPLPGPVLSDRAVQVTAFKKAEGGDDLIVRLFEPTGRSRRTTLSLDCVGVEAQIRMRPYEIKTLSVNRRSGRIREVNLLEE
jgi:alpha-mannosidase